VFVLERDREASIMRRPWPLGAIAPRRKKLTMEMNLPSIYIKQDVCEELQDVL
jgi:hypothetical protein